MYHNLLFIERPGHDDDNLWYPTTSMVTQEHTVMIADHYNHRISEFSLKGRFIRHVLSRKEGIYHPQWLSLQGNLLWLSYTVKDSLVPDKNIKCYKPYA